MMTEVTANVRRFTDDPRRTADTYYIDKDPLASVSGSVLEFVRTRAGHRVVDFGCGTGGYAARLQDLGFDVIAVDSNPAHVAITAGLGVRVQHVDGSLPFSNRSIDTLLMIEVLEHLTDDVIERVLAEARRVVRRNLLLTVPNCDDVGRLQQAGVTYEHFLAADHIQFFTRLQLETLFRPLFQYVEIIAGDPIRPHLLLPTIIRRPLSALYRLGLLRPSSLSRFFVEARVHG